MNAIEQQRVQRDADRFMARLAADRKQRVACTFGFSPTRERYEKHLTDAGLIERVMSPQKRKSWWVLTEAGRAALPEALKRYQARLALIQDGENERRLAEHRADALQRASGDLLAVARVIVGYAIHQEMDDTLAMDVRLTVATIRKARAAVAIADEPMTPQGD